MIHELGNVEYFELCETGSTLQYSYCLSYCAKGIVFCTCGICISHTDDMRRLNRNRFDALSISNHVIKKGCSHGARHGKSEEPIYYHKSFIAWKRCWKKSDESGQHFSGILDRSLKDSRYRETQAKHGWIEGNCKEMDQLVQEDHSFKVTKAELDRYRSNWRVQLNDSGDSGPMTSRADYKAAVASKNHLSRQSEDYQKPLPPQH